MRSARMWAVSLGIVAVVAVGLAQVGAQSEGKDIPVAIKRVEPQVVLYTIYRGDYDGVAQAIMNLFAVAGQKGLPLNGPLMFAYLNSPTVAPAGHQLIEIRLPVGAKGLELAGTLGDYTDVKRMPALEVAAIAKPAGVADPAPLHSRLMDWAIQTGRAPLEFPCEVFLTQGGGDYASMETELRLTLAVVAGEQPDYTVGAETPQAQADTPML
jgi:hypothetical protein